MAPVLRLLEPIDVSRVLGVSRRTVSRLEASGALEPAIVTGSGRRLYARSDVERVKRERTPKPEHNNAPAVSATEA